MTTTSKKKPRARTRRGKTRSEANPDVAIGFEIAVAESGPSNQRRAQELLDGLGYRVALDADAESLPARLRESPPDAVIIGLPDHSALVDECLAREPNRPIVIVSLPSPVTSARARSLEARADLFTMRPHSRDSLAAVTRAAEQMASLRSRIRSLRGSEDLLRERMKRFGQSDLATGFFHIDFFERVLVMELKRAKRYGYSLAACLVGLDAWTEDAQPAPAVATRLRRQAAEAIAKIVRDIDVPVDLADDRMLVFLPYTDLDGATRVGERIAKAVAAGPEVREGEQVLPHTVSVGIAALRQGKPVSFAKLTRDATQALKAARLKGGNQVVARS